MIYQKKSLMRKITIGSDDKTILVNVVGAYLIRGGALLLSLFSTPAYIRYFNNNSVLGVWYTMLSILNWVMMFDLGIGNGLRNKLTISVAEKNEININKYISSSYIAIMLVAICVGLLFFLFQTFIDWNHFLNIDKEIVNPIVLRTSMDIIIVGILLRFVLGLINSILFALQKSMINNLLALITNLLIYIFIIVAPRGNVDRNLISLSIVHVVLSNLPLLIASVVVFHTSLRTAKISFKFFDMTKAKEVIKIGTVLLWLQIVAMIVLSTHPIIISNITSPEDVVEYNIYYKVFGTLGSLITLAITPVWSAITKAKAEKNYGWIMKMYKIVMILPIITAIIDFILVFILQPFFNIWLGDKTIVVNKKIVFSMAVFNVIFVSHQVNTNINNGLEEFRTQTLLMSLAAGLMIPFSFLFCKVLNSWVGVIWACSLSVLPYCIVQPLVTIKSIKRMERRDLQ